MVMRIFSMTVAKYDGDVYSLIIQSHICCFLRYFSSHNIGWSKNELLMSEQIIAHSNKSRDVHPPVMSGLAFSVAEKRTVKVPPSKRY